MWVIVLAIKYHLPLDKFAEWAKKNNPAELEYLMPGGNINPDGDSPQRWEMILKEWRRNVD